MFFLQFFGSLARNRTQIEKTSVTHLNSKGAQNQFKHTHAPTRSKKKNGAGRSRVQGETGRTSGEVRGPSRGASRGWISEATIFFFVFFRFGLPLVADLVQSTNFSERERIAIAGESLFLFFYLVTRRREVNARRTSAISRARNTFASVGGVSLSRERERQRDQQAFRVKSESAGF